MGDRLGYGRQPADTFLVLVQVPRDVPFSLVSYAPELVLRWPERLPLPSVGELVTIPGHLTASHRSEVLRVARWSYRLLAGYVYGMPTPTDAVPVIECEAVDSDA